MFKSIENLNIYVVYNKFRLRFNMSKLVLAVNFAKLPSDKTKHIFSVHEKLLNSCERSLAFVYNSSLKSVYIGHTVRTCSSSSISALQKGHNLSSNGNRSYRPVSGLIGATPQRNLADALLYHRGITVFT